MVGGKIKRFAREDGYTEPSLATDKSKDILDATNVACLDCCYVGYATWALPVFGGRDQRLGSAAAL